VVARYGNGVGSPSRNITIFLSLLNIAIHIGGLVNLGASAGLHLVGLIDAVVWVGALVTCLDAVLWLFLHGDKCVGKHSLVLKVEIIGTTTRCLTQTKSADGPKGGSGVTTGEAPL
jgi:hypothetical protein